mgnify:FL=1
MNMQYFVLHYLWLIQVVIVAVLAFVAVYVEKRIYAKLLPRAKKTANIWDDVLIEALHAPAIFFIWLIAFCTLLQIVGSHTKLVLFRDWSKQIRETATAFIFVWFLVRFIRGIELSFSHKSSAKARMDETIVQAVCQILRLSMMITAGLILLPIFLVV